MILSDNLEDEMCYSIVLIIIFLFVPLVGFLMKYNEKKIINRLETHNLDKIIEKNVWAKKYMHFGIFLAFLSPTILFILLLFGLTKKIQDIIFCTIILIVVSMICFTLYFWKIEGVTKIIIEQRKNKH